MQVRILLLSHSRIDSTPPNLASKIHLGEDGSEARTRPRICPFTSPLSAALRWLQAVRTVMKFVPESRGIVRFIVSFVLMISTAVLASAQGTPVKASFHRGVLAMHNGPDGRGP